MQRLLLKSVLCMGLIVWQPHACAEDVSHVYDAAIAAELDAVARPTVPPGLKRYNDVVVRDELRLAQTEIDPYIREFGDKPFTCVDYAQHLPADDGKAQKAFDRFLESFEQGRRRGVVTVEEKRKRLALMQEAVAAGSWQARFADAVWDLWDSRPFFEKAQGSMKTLLSMAEQGNPLVLQTVLKWTEGRSQDEQFRLLRAAVDLGAPEILGNVGHRLAFNTLKYRAKGVAMLRCAVEHGNVDAYESLGKIFQGEGRWVDAYQIWQLGMNQGCKWCSDHIEGVARRQPGFSLGRDTTTDAVPSIKSLKKFYDNQLFWELTALPGTYRLAPAEMQFHMTEEELKQLMKDNMIVTSSKPRHWF